MNNLTKILLGGAALCALATAPAMGGDVSDFRATAQVDGSAAHKTMVHEPGRQHLTYTFALSTYVPASDLDKTVNLTDTFYQVSGTCRESHVKIKLSAKKTEHAKIGTFIETNGDHCDAGDTFTLTSPAGEGHIDTFVSSLSYDFQNGGVKYRGVLNLDPVSVQVGQ